MLLGTDGQSSSVQTCTRCQQTLISQHLHHSRCCVGQISVQGSPPGIRYAVPVGLWFVVQGIFKPGPNVPLVVDDEFGYVFTCRNGNYSVGTAHRSCQAVCGLPPSFIVVESKQ